MKVLAFLCSYSDAVNSRHRRINAVNIFWQKKLDETAERQLQYPSFEVSLS